MESLTLFIHFFCLFGTLSVLSQSVPTEDVMLLQPPSGDRPHHVQRRVMEEEDPFMGDPTIRFFLRLLMAPFSIFEPERNTRRHADKFTADTNGNSTDKKTTKSKNFQMNETKITDAVLGNTELKPKTSGYFRAAHRNHFRFDPFHHPADERNGPVIDREARKTGVHVSTGKHFGLPVHFGKQDTLKTAGSTHEKNITNINFNRRHSFIWSVEWRSLVMHIIVVMVFALIITLALLFCQTVFSMRVKTVRLNPEKPSRPEFV